MVNARAFRRTLKSGLVVLQGGAVVEWLEHSPLVLKVSGSKQSVCVGFFKILSVYPTINVNPAVFRVGKVKAVGRESGTPP